MLVARSTSIALTMALSAPTLAQSSRLAVFADRSSDLLSIVDVDTLAPAIQVPSGGLRPIQMVASLDGQSVYVLHDSQLGGSGDVHVVNVNTQTHTGSLPGQVDRPSQMALSSNGRWLVIAGETHATLHRHDLTHPLEAPVQLELDPASSFVGRVDLVLSEDGRHAFVSASASGTITQVDLETMLPVASIASGVVGSEVTEDIQAWALPGTDDEYIVAWTRNTPSLIFSTWNTQTGLVTATPFPTAGRGFQIAVDRTSPLVAVSGDFIATSGSYGGGIVLWDLLTTSLQANIETGTSTLPVREILFSQGNFYALKFGSGLREIDPVTTTITTEYDAAGVAWQTSRIAATRAADRLLYTTSPVAGVTHLVVVDPETQTLLGEIPVPSPEPVGLVVAECGDTPGLDWCSGDGGDQLGCTSCPCGNEAPAGTLGGCLNSAGSSAQLRAEGSVSVNLPVNSAEDLRFSLRSTVPGTLCVLTSAQQVEPNSAGHPCAGANSGLTSLTLDGLQCVSSNVRRHGARLSSSLGHVGMSNEPWGGEARPNAGLANAGPGFQSGQTRFFQALYREHALAVCGRGVNSSQAIEVTFCP